MSQFPGDGSYGQTSTTTFQTIWLYRHQGLGCGFHPKISCTLDIWMPETGVKPSPKEHVTLCCLGMILHIFILIMLNIIYFPLPPLNLVLFLTDFSYLLRRYS